MKPQINTLLLAARQAELQATEAHRTLATACQTLQEALAGAFRRRLCHGTVWTVNAVEWSVAALEVWVTDNVEFSRPTLKLFLRLRPTDDTPLLSILLEASLPLTAADLTHELPCDLTLPTTMPMNQPVTLYPHYRARAWKTFPEVTMR
ncbi:MAG: hypothetical protein IJ700_04835 [Bacteroidaceae bacterium]|nr:hypothetical protein [Bacteroidaceae bacterium]MBR1755414.1 hypothetical protein [Bacteroidaceae bacterium]